MSQMDFKRAFAIAVAAFAATGCVVIEDGEVGVSKSFGRIKDEPVGRGVVIQIPLVRTVETWNVKLQEHKETAQVPSSEGLIIGLDTSLLFQVLPEAAPSIRETVGWNYVERLIVPYFRSALRDVVSGYPVKQVYAEEGRKAIASKIKTFLEENLEPRGILVVEVLLRDVKLPQRFKESIEAKLTAEQRVQQKQFELEQAVKDAEIEVARARGAAESQQIVRSTLSDAYLQYLWIKTLNDHPNVIYVATEANMPILKGTQ
ncbi:MAG TPA: prohibitin family protein [Myxococcota bacterium]|nr:prohibitin family protein [Myxococcota bacterium]